MIAIVDYGVGNLGSIRNMIKKVGVSDVEIVSSIDNLKRADKYILPGVGAFDTGMKMFNDSGMREELDYQIKEAQKPILGICLGMQMLGNGSEEGIEQGLGYIDFYCRRFKLDNTSLRIPHMGWDYVKVMKNTSLTKNPENDLKYYFVHSYYAECKDNANVLFSCDYGIEFVAGVNKGNIYGVQFHPEKSHSFGMWLMKNFAEEV